MSSPPSPDGRPKRSIRRLIVPLVTLGVGLAAGAGGEALAHGSGTQTAPTASTSAGADAIYLTASLIGQNEVPGGKGAVGDPKGRAVEIIRVKGDQVSFAIRWQGMGTLTEAHVHLGAVGVNGPVKIDLFGAGMPGNANAAVGTVTVKDRALLKSLRSNPGALYANLHTAAFPGGAVRGQLHRLSHAVDLNAVLQGGPLVSIDSGDQEIPSPGKVTGAPDAHGTGFIGAGPGQIDYAFTWSGAPSPTAGHLHQGAVGTNGPVVVPFFASASGLPASITGLAGEVTGVSPELTQQITADPAGFYTNLHTARFPGGALRGQLQGTGTATPSVLTASVVTGTQIYACTQQPGGGFSFTQHDVNAELQSGIHHSFVTPDAGPPQWVADDGSAVTGKVVTKTPHGADNIPELDLAATQSGRTGGLLSSTTEVLRLNTIGGLAPAGACDPQTQPTVGVPYKADYLFIGT